MKDEATYIKELKEKEQNYKKPSYYKSEHEEEEEEYLDDFTYFYIFGGVLATVLAVVGGFWLTTELQSLLCIYGSCEVLNIVAVIVGIVCMLWFFIVIIYFLKEDFNAGCFLTIAFFLVLVVGYFKWLS